MVTAISDGGGFAAVLILGQQEWNRPWPFFIGDRNLPLYFFSVGMLEVRFNRKGSLN